MSPSFHGFHQAYPRSPTPNQSSAPLPRRRAIREELGFQAAYWLFLMPIVIGIHTLAVARGLATLWPWADRGVWRYPLGEEEGAFHVNITAGMLAAVACYCAVSWFWERTIMWSPSVAVALRKLFLSQSANWCFWLAFLTLLSFEFAMCYYGLRAPTRWIWRTRPDFVVPLAAIFCCSMVMLASWIRVDHRNAMLS